MSLPTNIQNALIQESQRNTLSFLYGNERIVFQCMPVSDKRRNVLIKVHPDCRVEVSVPLGTEDAEVLAAVKKRGRWIYEQLREFRQQMEYLTPREYVSGEAHYYLGKQYMLKVVIAPKEKQGVKLLRGKLLVTVRQQNPEKIRQLLAQWYRIRASIVFAKRLDTLLEQTLWVKELPELNVLNMKTQWGSCSPNGALLLNPNLVKASRQCVDYVILHELCHIAEHNHSENFYRLMYQVMPNWEETKTRLDQLAGKLLNS